MKTIGLRHAAGTDYVTNINDGKKLSPYRHRGKSIGKLYGFTNIRVSDFYDNKDVAPIPWITHEQILPN